MPGLISCLACLLVMGEHRKNKVPLRRWVWSDTHLLLDLHLSRHSLGTSLHTLGVCLLMIFSPSASVSFVDTQIMTVKTSMEFHSFYPSGPF